MTGRRAEITIDSGICQLIGEGLYSSPWESIWVRETQQNSGDAGADEIHYNYGEEMVDGNKLYWLSCQDNGCGMTPDTFIDYFLKVGASYKPDSPDPVGGFGVAKLAILAGIHWRVITKHRNGQEFSFDNTMLGEEVKPSLVSVIPGESGTFIKVWRDHPFYQPQLEKSLIYSRPRQGVNIYLTGDRIKHLNTGRQFSEVGFATFSQNKAQSQDHSGVHVRMKTKEGNLVYQFTHPLYTINRCVFLDVDSSAVPPVRDPGYPFTASREAFTYKYRRIIDEQVEKMTVDPITMMQPKEPEIILHMLQPVEEIRRLREEAAERVERTGEPARSEMHESEFSYNITYEDENGEVKNSRVTSQKILYGVTTDIDIPILIYKFSGYRGNGSPEKERRNVKVLKAMRAMLDALGLERIGVGFSLTAKAGGFFLRGLQREYILVAPGHIPTNSKDNMFRLLLVFLSHELAHYYSGSYHNQDFAYRQYGLLRDFNTKQYDDLLAAFETSQEEF